MLILNRWHQRCTGNDAILDFEFWIMNIGIVSPLIYEKPYRLAYA